MATVLVACGGDAADESSGVEDELRSSEAVLRVPLLDRDGKLLKTHNDELEAAGLDPIRDETVEFRASRLAAAQRKWDAVAERVDQAQERDIDLEMRRYGEPADYVTRDENTICWKGSALKAIDLISSLSDNVFSDQLSVHGWRYKARKFSYNDVEDSEYPRIWREWRGNGEAILMVTASSDGGEEMNVAIIPKCR